MMTKKGFFERRKYKRVKAKEGTVADFHKARFLKIGKPRLVKSVPISDISLGGLQFQYTSQDMWSAYFDTLTISKSPDNIRIDNVPFKAITDCSTSRLQGSEPVRRCGVKFGELTSEQKSDLIDFIQKHAISDHTIDRRTGTDRRNMDDARDSDRNRREKIERRKIKLGEGK